MCAPPAQAINRCCSGLEMLLLGGSPASLQCGQLTPELAELYRCAEAEVAQISEALPNSVLGQLPHAAAFACHLAVFAAAAPRLATLEVTGLGLHLAVSAYDFRILGHCDTGIVIRIIVTSVF